MANERYEYKKVGFNEVSGRHYGELDLEKLKEHTKDGWELLMMVSGELVFKRPIQNEGYKKMVEYLEGEAKYWEEEGHSGDVEYIKSILGKLKEYLGDDND
ncbi:hypothetical protein [Bacillus phage YungSlug]|nr:hypothetical protein [Bacillus phage YungSlug]